MIPKRWCLRCETGIIRQGALRADGVDIASMCRACSMTYHEMRWSLQPDPFAWEHTREEWRGREDEANAWGGLVGGGSMYTAEEMRGFEMQGRRDAAMDIDSDDESDLGAVRSTLAFDAIHEGDVEGGDEGGDGDMGDEADARIGHTSRDVPAWNEPRAVTFLRGLPPNLLLYDVKRWRAMVMTPAQVVAWEDNDGRILFDTVNTRGAVDARWVNEPGATPRQTDDKE